MKNRFFALALLLSLATPVVKADEASPVVAEPQTLVAVVEKSASSEEVAQAPEAEVQAPEAIDEAANAETVEGFEEVVVIEETVVTEEAGKTRLAQALEQAKRPLCQGYTLLNNLAQKNPLVAISVAFGLGVLAEYVRENVLVSEEDAA